VSNFTEVDGVHFYANRLDRMQEIEIFGSNSTALSMHVIRHLVSLSDSAAASYIGHTFKERGEVRQITAAFLDEQVRCVGSKFHPDLDHPTLIINHALRLAGDHIADGNEVFWLRRPGWGMQVARMQLHGCPERLGVPHGELGTASVVPITLDNQDDVIRKPRGFGEDVDRVVVNQLRGNPPTTDNLIIEYRKHKGSRAKLHTVYTGYLCPPMPRADQPDEELAYNKAWWNTHAFVV
jgi:hypothetical protein